MQKRWLILGIFIFIAMCVIFGDRQHLRYLYELHITPILKSGQTNQDHICEGRIDNFLPVDMVNDNHSN